MKTRNHSIPVFLCAAVLTLGMCCPKKQVATHPIVTEKELLITALDVVESDNANNPAGVWHIKHLFSQLARNGDPSQFALDWLKTWEKENTVNNLPQPARVNIRSTVIDPWKAASGQAGKPDAETVLNFSKAPFRLLAIVYRPDLAHTNALGKVERAGEARFVFNVLLGGNASSFSIIMEYELPAKDACDIQTWAERWHALSHPNNNRAKYLQDLALITESFAGKSRKLRQLRSNEFVVSPSWELREWNLDETTHRLVPTTTKQNPAQTHNNSQTLKEFVQQNESQILAGTVQMPAQIGQTAFLGNHSPVQEAWAIPGIGQSSEVRKKFAVLTCNGCHQHETGIPFVHISNREKNGEATASSFLTSAPFNDLAARREILAQQLGMPSPIGSMSIKVPGSLSPLPPSRTGRVH